MSEFDPDSSTATEADSEAVSAMRGATRLAERFGLELKIALAFAIWAALGFAVRATFTNQLGDNMGAMMVWFAVIFGVATAVLGGFIKLGGAVQKRRHDWE